MEHLMIDQKEAAERMEKRAANRNPKTGTFKRKPASTPTPRRPAPLQAKTTPKPTTGSDHEPPIFTVVHCGENPALPFSIRTPEGAVLSRGATVIEALKVALANMPETPKESWMDKLIKFPAKVPPLNAELFEQFGSDNPKDETPCVICGNGFGSHMGLQCPESRNGINVRYDLLEGSYLEAMAKVMDRGAKVWGSNSWRKGLTGCNSGINHALHHLTEYLKDGNPDHLASAGVNLQFQFWFDKQKEGGK